jgi:hypothetical protein
MARDNPTAEEEEEEGGGGQQTAKGVACACAAGTEAKAESLISSLAPRALFFPLGSRDPFGPILLLPCCVSLCPRLSGSNCRPMSV